MPVAVNSTLAYANGVLGSSPAGLLKCDGFALSPGTGAEIWDTDDTGSPGAAAGPPIVVDGRVYCFCKRRGDGVPGMNRRQLAVAVRAARA